MDSDDSCKQYAKHSDILIKDYMYDSTEDFLSQ